MAAAGARRRDADEPRQRVAPRTLDGTDEWLLYRRAGAMAIVLSKIGFGFEQAGGFGVALTLAGSLMSALNQPLLMASPDRIH